MLNSILNVDTVVIRSLRKVKENEQEQKVVSVHISRLKLLKAFRLNLAYEIYFSLCVFNSTPT